ncbi:MAG: hypothetical protein ABI880_07530 [Acidobacteriota bacterium]
MTRGAALAGGLAFIALATLNAGGYRYGASDQAFYIPAILHQLDPSLYPRDWAMLGAQGKFFFVDEIFAALVRVTGVALPFWFAAAQLATLTALAAGAYALGRQVLDTPLAIAAWMAALTLRHRITKTGANTLEGYFHPRMLVFAIGLFALADVLRGRRWRPLLITLLCGAIHPTTAALFVAIVTVAIGVSDVRWRRPLLAGATVTGVLAALTLALGATPFDLTPMDAEWRALVATKDYTFPTAWSPGTWATNLAAPFVLVAVAWARRRDGRLTLREQGLIAGCLALVAGFLASLPFISAGVPLAVQLQTSRVFWPVEAVAVLYLVWWAVDRPARQGSVVWPRALAAVVVAVAVARGIYVGLVESPDRPTFAFDLPADDWAAALTWVRTSTPSNTYVLADPSHAWEMGTAVRIGAARDVYLEETKDVAMAMYSRPAAHRVAARITATQGFSAMSPDALRALVAGDGPAVLVSERPLALPVLFQTGVIRVYALTD